MSVWGELRRRNVVKVGVAYLIVAWLIAQVVSVVEAPMGLPDWFDTAVLVLLAIGFPLALLLAWAYELTPEGIRKTRRVPLEDSLSHIGGQRLNYIVTALLVLAVGFMAVDNYWLGSERDLPANAIERIAVLPCDDLSPDPNDSYFATGIHDELLNRLAQIPGLGVISRSSVMQYAENRPPIPQIGEALGVDTIMECGVRYNADQVALTAQLIDARSDEHVWSETYTGDMTDLVTLFEIQGNIAMNVANTLRVEFFGQDVPQTERAPTESRVAYEHYLQGLALMRRNTPEAVGNAVEEFAQALERDPEFGLAHIALGQALSSAWVPSTPAVVDRRERAILDAVQFAPDEPGTQLLLAGRLERSWQWSRADEAYRRAHDLAPDSLDANFGYGSFLRVTGRVREALPYAQAARDADPAVLNREMNLGQTYDAIGEHAQAVVHFENARTLLGVQPLAEGQYLYSLIGAGAYDEARQLWASMAPLQGEMGPGLVALYRTSMELLDDPVAARAALRRLPDDFPGLGLAPLSAHLANMAAHFGDSEFAIEMHRRSVEMTTLPFVYIWRPIWQNVRPEPEFKAFIAETGLPGYWREHGWPEHCRPLGEQDFTCE